MVQIIFSEVFLEDLSEQIDRARAYRSEKSARALYDSVHEAAGRLKDNPAIGRVSKIDGVRSVGIALDFRLYYEVIGESIMLLSIFSTRANPEDNPFE